MKRKGPRQTRGFLSISAILLLITQGLAQVESVTPEVVLNPEIDPEALFEQSEYLNFERISPGNYLLTNKVESKELTQEEAQEIQTYFAKAVSFSEPSKQYCYTRGNPPMMVIARRNTAIDPFTGAVPPEILLIMLRSTTITTYGHHFSMTPAQGAKLLDKINSVLNQ